MTYLPPQAKLLFKDIQRANQTMLANSARMEEAVEQTSGPTIVETAFAPDPPEVAANSDIALQSVDRALGSEQSTYRLDGGHRELNAAEILQSDMLTLALVGPSIEAPPVRQTPE